VENSKRTDGSPCEHVARRIICFKMGRAKFVTDFAEVNHEAGLFKNIVREKLIDFLKDPVVWSLMFNDYILPFGKENRVGHSNSL
jgi:hypothetical protein